MKIETLALIGLGLLAISQKQTSSPSPAAPPSPPTDNLSDSYTSDPYIFPGSSTSLILEGATNAADALAKLSRNVDSPFSPGSPNFTPPDLSENNFKPVTPSERFSNAGMEAYSMQAQNQAVAAKRAALIAQYGNPTPGSGARILDSQLVTWSEQAGYGAHDAARQTYENAWNSNDLSFLNSIK